MIVRDFLDITANNTPNRQGAYDYRDYTSIANSTLLNEDTSSRDIEYDIMQKYGETDHETSCLFTNNIRINTIGKHTHVSLSEEMMHISSVMRAISADYKRTMKQMAATGALTGGIPISEEEYLNRTIDSGLLDNYDASRLQLMRLRLNDLRDSTSELMQTIHSLTNCRYTVKSITTKACKICWTVTTAYGTKEISVRYELVNRKIKMRLSELTRSVFKTGWHERMLIYVAIIVDLLRDNHVVKAGVTDIMRRFLHNIDIIPVFKSRSIMLDVDFPIWLLPIVLSSIETTKKRTLFRVVDHSSIMYLGHHRNNLTEGIDTGSYPRNTGMMSLADENLQHPEQDCTIDSFYGAHWVAHEQVNELNYNALGPELLYQEILRADSGTIADYSYTISDESVLISVNRNNLEHVIEFINDVDNSDSNEISLVQYDGDIAIDLIRKIEEQFTVNGTADIDDLRLAVIMSSCFSGSRLMNTNNMNGWEMYNTLKAGILFNTMLRQGCNHYIRITDVNVCAKFIRGIILRTTSVYDNHPSTDQIKEWLTDDIIEFGGTLSVPESRACWAELLGLKIILSQSNLKHDGLTTMSHMYSKGWVCSDKFLVNINEQHKNAILDKTDRNLWHVSNYRNDRNIGMIRAMQRINMRQLIGGKCLKLGRIIRSYEIFIA